MPKTVRAFWAREQNFGDCLTESLLATYGIQCAHVRPHFASLIGVGSILERVPSAYQGIVLGSGLMWEHSALRLPNARLLALRGPLSRARVTGMKPLVLGDPGLLAPRLLAPQGPPRYRLGLVPHYVDQGNPVLRRLQDRHSDSITIINVRQSPIEAIAGIAGCAAVISSSLHGLIVADALGIPSGWHYVPGVLGSGFKFQDHFATVESARQPLALHGEESMDELLRLTSPAPARANLVAAELHDVFCELPVELSRLDDTYLHQWQMFLASRVERLFRRRNAA